MLSALLRRDFSKLEDEVFTKKVASFDKGFVLTAEGAQQLVVEEFELAGFPYIRFTILANWKMACNKKVKMVIAHEEQQHEFISDTEETSTDYSSTLCLGLTSFEFDFDEELRALLAAEGEKVISFYAEHRPYLIKEKYQISIRIDKQYS